MSNATTHCLFSRRQFIMYKANLYRSVFLNICAVCDLCDPAPTARKIHEFRRITIAFTLTQDSPRARGVLLLLRLSYLYMYLALYRNAFWNKNICIILSVKACHSQEFCHSRNGQIICKF